MQLTVTVVLPLLLGHAIKYCTKVSAHKVPLSSISQCALLFVIYTTFCDTFSVPETELSALDVLFTIFSVLTLQVILTVISFKISRFLKDYFTPADIIAVVFCSTHKSLTLGQLLLLWSLNLYVIFLVFRHSHTKNNVPWLLTLSSDKFATFGISPYSDYFRRAYGITVKGVVAFRKTWKPTNIIEII